MFQELLKNKKFKNLINNFYVKHKTKIFDLIIFGSTVKGKEKPEDLDLLMLFKNKEDLETSYLLKKILEPLNLKTNITTKTYDSLLSKTFLAKEAFLSEGYSLVHNEFVSKNLGYTSFMMFKYELKKFNQSQRMRFHYSLHGRNKYTGMIKKLNLIKFSDTIILSPVTNTENTREYLKYWKINFQEIPVLIPSRIINLQH